MKYIIDDEKKLIVPTQILNKEEAAKVISNPTRSKILELLSKKAMYPSMLARELGIHEQIVYYHIRMLKKEGLIKEGAATGNIKPYSARKIAFSIIPAYVKARPANLKPYDFMQVPEILNPFVKNGRINCRVVVGAPVPHGKFNRSGISGHLAGNITALLGNYGTFSEPITCTDLDIENYNGNFITIDGLRVNMLQKEFNARAPIRLSKSGNRIISDISGKEYTEPQHGFITKFRNPKNKKYWVICIAGISTFGNRAAIYAFSKYLDEVNKGNVHDPAQHSKVVEGFGTKDKIVDVRFLE